MAQTHLEQQISSDLSPLSTKLWIYTNYDCNLKCTYCVAESHPSAPRRAFHMNTIKRIIDEAVELGFESIYLTGGEPFILSDIYEILAYSSDKLPTTILTNAMLFSDTRLKRLIEVNNENLFVQVSLDGSRPEHHDPYRGSGSWQKTVDGVRKLLESGFQIRLSTTETPANSEFLNEICDFRRTLGVSDEDHFIRPLAKRGFSEEGLEVGKKNLVPEMTINTKGVYWHPLSTDPDLLVSTEIFPLAKAYNQIKLAFEELTSSHTSCMEEFQ